MESLFPENKQDEKALFKAFESLEKEKTEALLRQHGIHRPGKVIQHDFRTKVTKWWIAAAILLITAGSVFYYTQLMGPSPQQLADNALSTVVKDYNFTVRSANTEAVLGEVQKLINNGDYDNALKQLDLALKNTSPADTSGWINLHFYSGVVLLHNHDFSSSIGHFDSVAKYPFSSLYLDAVWLRGLAYFKAGKPEDAKEDFKLIAQQKNWIKAEEAKKILDSLEE